MSIQNSHRIEDVKIMLKMGVNGKGISSIVKTSTVGLVDTYTITYDDGTKSTYDVTNGRGIVSLVKTGTTGLVDSYRITYNDGSVFDYTVTNAKSIVNISKTETEGFVDTYTITFNDGTSTTYDVVNGSMGVWTSAVTGAVGATSVTINSADIETTSVIDIYCQNNSGTSITIKEVTLSNGQAVLTFNPLIEATDFMIHIINAIGESVNENEVITRSTLTAHNLLPNTAKTTSVNGVTFTVNEDGTVTASTGAGTATASAYLYLPNTIDLDLIDGQQYILSGLSSNGSSSTFDIGIGNYGNSGSGKELTFTYNKNVNGQIFFRVYNGASVNVTFSPMIRLATDADATYRPFAMTNKQLTDNKVGWDSNILLGAHNLLPNNSKSTTKNGLTFTVNSDKTVTVSGTASTDTSFNIYTANGSEPFVGQEVIVTGCPSNGSFGTYILQASRVTAVDGGAGSTVDEKGTGATLTWKNNGSGTKASINIYVFSGYTFTTPLTFKPMIRLASDTDATYQPYAKTNKQLTNNISSIESNLATVEIGTASKAYAKGDFLIMNDTLYKVTTATVAGATLTVGTNIVQTSVAEELELNNIQLELTNISTNKGIIEGVFTNVIPLLTQDLMKCSGVVKVPEANSFGFSVLRVSSTMYYGFFHANDRVFTAVSSSGTVTAYQIVGTAI